MTTEILHQLGVAGAVISGTAIVQAMFIFLIRPLIISISAPGGSLDVFLDILRLVFVAVWLIGAHTVSAGLWAGAYLHFGISDTFSDALYFALSTYTTIGFGDVLAPQEWQLLTGFSGLNGLLMFGLSAAVLVDAAGRIRGAVR